MFLASETEVYDAFHETIDRPALLRPLLSSAQHLAAGWDHFGNREIRTVIRSCVQKVLVEDSNVRILVSRPNLRQFLQNPEALSSDVPATEATDLFTLKVDAKRRRCGGQQNSRKIPVFTLFAGNFGRRTVSARLRAPPRSLDRREYPRSLLRIFRINARIPRKMRIKTDWRERTAEDVEPFHSVFSPLPKL